MHYQTDGYEKDCLLCCLKVLLILSKICGLPLHNTCSCKTDSVTKPSFYRFLTLPILAPQIMHAINIIERYRNCAEIVSSLEMLIVAVLFCYFAINLIVFQLKMAARIAQFKRILFIVENHYYYGINSFVTAEMRKRFKMSTYYFCTYFLFSEILLFANYRWNKEDVLSYKSLTNFIASTIKHFSEGVLLYQTYVFIILYRNMYKKCLEDLRRQFDIKLNKRTNDEKIRRLTNVYICVTRSYKQLEDVLNPFLLIWNITGTLMLILIFFYLLLGYGRNATINFVVVIQSIVFILIMLWYLVNGEKMQDVADDLLSFLFKYPLSRLPFYEASRIELIIMTLQIHKPILSASDMFTVGTKLLSSICGTVVTYVLVALQFYASLKK